MSEMEVKGAISEEKAAGGVADSLSVEEETTVREMMEIGVFYGQSKSRTNPKMKPYILTNRSGFAVIDLEKTLASLKRTEKIVAKTLAKGGKVLLIGTSPSVKGAIKEMADELEQPYVTERWLGGTLTNFETITKRIKHMRQLKEEKTRGDWDKYTKKEQLDLERELAKLTHLFGGIEDLQELPALAFIADLSSNVIAAKEARAAGVPIVGIINTDADPSLVNVGIPANERGQKSVEFVISRVKEIIANGLKSAAQAKAAAAEGISGETAVKENGNS